MSESIIDVETGSGDRTPDNLEQPLEQGRIVHFPTCPIELPSPADLTFLRDELPQLLKRKNVSYHPEAGRVVGIEADPKLVERARAILSEHARRVQTFLEQTVPAFVPGWTVGTSSMRPMEERGRGLKPHASNELVHVDAGAYGATNGDRILRFFVNVNPSEDRVWATRGTFPELFERYARSAGLSSVAAKGLEKGLLDHARTGALRAVSALGLRLAKTLDSSPYDRAMRRFHNFMKDDPAFRGGRDGYEQFRFRPSSAWMVFTDMRSHACLAGRHALVNTFLVPLENCQRRKLAPHAILQRLSTPG